jgi:platelet-activating factor acetylhydrolase
VWPWDDKNNKVFWKKNKEHIVERYKKIRGAHIDWRVEQMSALIN